MAASDYVTEGQITQLANHVQALFAAKSAEWVQDTVASLLQAGSGVTLSYSDSANALLISATGGGGTAGTPSTVDFSALITN